MFDAAKSCLAHMAVNTRPIATHRVNGKCGVNGNKGSKGTNERAFTIPYGLGATCWKKDDHDQADYKKSDGMNDARRTTKAKSLSEIETLEGLNVVQMARLYLRCPQTRVFLKTVKRSPAFEAWVR